MKKVRWTGYDKYLVFADKTNVLKGNYNGYINFKDVMDVVDKLHAKRNNSYLYNGELLTFDIKQGDIESLYDEQSLPSQKANELFLILEEKGQLEL